MKKLANGQSATLGSYRETAIRMYGAESPAVKWLEREIATAKHGPNEEVIMEETKVLAKLAEIVIHAKEVNA